jgi:hypothetical protein
MVALYKQAYPLAPRQKCLPTPDERPQQATGPINALYQHLNHEPQTRRKLLKSKE